MQIRIEPKHQLAKFLTRDVHLAIATGMRIAAERLAARAKLAYRGEVRKSGLGDRLADTVRVNVYPKSASSRTHAPAVFVYTKAPEIIRAFTDGVTIASRRGVWLAIPTENVPRVARQSSQEAVGRRGTRFQSRASPREVERMFGQKLIFMAGRGQQMLAFIDARRTKSGKLRSGIAKSGRRARSSSLVLMFVMVRQVHLRKRIDFDRVTAELARDWAALADREVAMKLAA